MRWRDRVTRWAVRLLAVAFMGGVVVLGAASPAHAECKAPASLPNYAGSGLPGMIDDQATSSNPTTLYGQYGWAGMSWDTCDLGDGSWGNEWVPDPAKDPAAYMDTFWGNAGMGLAVTLGASMAQLHQWVAAPTVIMGPVDDQISGIVNVVRDSVWSPWVAPVIVLAAIFVAIWAHQGDVRRSARTMAAIIIACGAVAMMGASITTKTVTDTMDPKTGKPVVATQTAPGSVIAARYFDAIAIDIVAAVDNGILDLNNQSRADADEIRGATMQDKILYRLWAKGATGSDDPNSVAGQYARKIYEIKAVKWSDADKVDPAQRQDQYKKLAEELKKADPRAYYQLTGKAGGRSGLGWMGALMMLLIAIVRIPAELLLLAGLLVVRIVVMLLPLFALAGIVEATRPIAISAAKMVFAAVYNSAVFGVIASLHTAIVTAVITNTANQVVACVLVLGLTIVIWMASKPFRSVTRPATGQAVGEAMTGVGDAPANAMQGVKALLGSAAGSYLGSKAGTKKGTEEAKDDNDQAPPTKRGRPGHEPATTPDLYVRSEQPYPITIKQPHPGGVTDEQPAMVPPGRALPAATPPQLTGGPDRHLAAVPSGPPPFLPPAVERAPAPAHAAIEPAPQPAADVISVERRAEVQPASQPELTSGPPMRRDVVDASIFIPPPVNGEHVVIQGEVVEVTELVPVEHTRRYAEPEITRDGQLTYDVWRPEPEQTRTPELV